MSSRPPCASHLRPWHAGKNCGHAATVSSLRTSAPWSPPRRPNSPTAAAKSLAAVGASLIARPSALAATGPAPPAYARVQLALAVEAVRGGNRARARQHAISASLEDFELVADQLSSIDDALRLEAALRQVWRVKVFTAQGEVRVILMEAASGHVLRPLARRTLSSFSLRSCAHPQYESMPTQDKELS